MANQAIANPKTPSKATEAKPNIAGDIVKSLPTGAVASINELPQAVVNTVSFGSQLGEQVGNKLHNQYSSNPYTPEQQTQNIRNAAIQYQAPTLNQLTGGHLSAPIALGFAKTINALTPGSQLTDEDLIKAAQNYTPEQAQNALHTPETSSGEAAKGLATALPQMLATGVGPIAGALGYGGSSLASKYIPDSPVAQLLGGALGTGIGGATENAISLKPETVAPVSNNIISKTLQNDDVDPVAAQNKLASMGPDAMLADAAGENTRGIARAIANMPGKAREIATQALEERQAGQPDRITQAVTKGLGVDPTATAESTVQELIKQREDAAQPAYEKAFKSGPVISDRLNEFLEDPEIKGGLSRGIKIQRLESLANGEKFDPKDYGITDFNAAGDPVISGVPNMRLLDAAKKGLDAKISDNTDPVTGKVNELGRALTKVKGSFLNEVDNINPDYAAARKSFSGPSQSIDAINTGKDFIKNGGEINAKLLDNISDQDKPFFRIGVAQKISDVLQNTPDGADAVKRIFGTPAKRAALKSVFPDEESFNNFEKTVNNEKEFTKTYRAALQGSRTAPLAADIDDLSNQLSGKAKFAKAAVRHSLELAQRNAPARIIYGTGHLLNKLAQPKEMSEAQAVDLANRLFTPNGATVGQRPPIATANPRVNAYINSLMSATPYILPAAASPNTGGNNLQQNPQ